MSRGVGSYFLSFKMFAADTASLISHYHDDANFKFAGATKTLGLKNDINETEMIYPPQGC